MVGGRGLRVDADDVALLLPRYLEQAKHYLVNTERLAAQGDHAKAGEALWGAAASALKALQLARQGRRLGRGEVDGVGKAVARELGMVEAFAAIRTLHANFYDPFLDADEVAREAAEGIRYVTEVLRRAEPASAEPARPTAP